MSAELDLLLLFAEKETFDRFHRFIKKSTVTKESWTIISDMFEWYDKHSKIDWDSFNTWFRVVRHPTFKKETLDLYSIIFDRLSGQTLGDTSEAILKRLIERDYATKLSSVAMSIAEGENKHLWDEVIDLTDEYYIDIGRAAEIASRFVADDISAMVGKVTGKGLDWRLNELNYSCGPIRQGDFIVVAAYVDTGKTTFIASESTYMAKQLEEGECVIWFNNEEDGSKVKYRTVQATLAKDHTALAAMNPADVTREYNAALGGESRLMIYDEKYIHIKDVEEVLKHYNPGLIIFDQLFKIAGFQNEFSEVERQRRLFGWARKLAADYCPVIAVTQADSTTNGEMYIEANQLYGSKVAMQSEADAIITIGRSLTGAFSPTTRFIYVPKNKLTGGPLSDERFRNGKFEVQIEPTIARYRGSM